MNSPPAPGQTMVRAAGRMEDRVGEQGMGLCAMPYRVACNSEPTRRLDGAGLDYLPSFQTTSFRALRRWSMTFARYLGRGPWPGSGIHQSGTLAAPAGFSLSQPLRPSSAPVRWESGLLSSSSDLLPLLAPQHALEVREVGFHRLGDFCLAGMVLEPRFRRTLLLRSLRSAGFFRKISWKYPCVVSFPPSVFLGIGGRVPWGAYWLSLGGLPLFAINSTPWDFG